MERGKPWIYALGGFTLGVLLTSAVWLGAGTRTESGVTAVPEEPRPMGSEAVPSAVPDEAGPSPETPEAEDGGDGERHSPYQFAVDCGRYWKETRGLPAHKVVLGLPFYTRPSWAGYGAILASVPEASDRDHVSYNGMEVHYNGVDTIREKTRYALETLGGVMIWELTQDTSDRSKSLLHAIGDALEPS